MEPKNTQNIDIFDELDAVTSPATNFNSSSEDELILSDPSPKYNLNTKTPQSSVSSPKGHSKLSKKHKIWMYALGGVAAAGLISTMALGISQCSNSKQPITPATKFKINIGSSEHCKVTIEESKTQAVANETVKLTVSEIESGYSLVCSSINESQYLFFDENNQVEFKMPAYDVKLDVYCMETPPIPPTPTVYHTVLFNVDESQGEQLVGSGYSVVEEGEYFGWVNKPIATKTDPETGEKWTFVCWTDSEGNKISNIHEITSNMSVHASFVKETDKVYSYDDVLGYFEIVDASSSTENIEVIIETEEVENITTPKHVNIPKDQFNFPVYFGSKITEIKDGFLQGCTAFNQPIVIGSNIKKIGKSFLKGCTSFNSTIEINNSVEEITSSENQDEGFMYGCSSFNQSLSIPKNLTALPNSFLSGCSEFNQTLIIPENIKSIGKWFLNNCASFNQNILLPPTIESIAEDFMFNCDSMISTISIQFNPVDPQEGTQLFKITDKTLSTENELADCYTKGVTIGGSYGEVFRGMCGEERTSSPFRKLNSFTEVCFISFYSNGGGEIIDESIVVIKSGTTFGEITKPKTKPNTGFRFDKWTYADGTEVADSDVFVEDTLIRANFVEDLATIKFFATGPGTISGETQRIVLKKTLFKDVLKPTPNPNNKCIFDGWYLNGQKISDTTMIQESCSIEARFINKPVSVSIVTQTQGTVVRTFECNKDISIQLRCKSMGPFPWMKRPVQFVIATGGRNLVKNTDYTTTPDQTPQPAQPEFIVTLTIKNSSFADDIKIQQLPIPMTILILGVV